VVRTAELLQLDADLHDMKSFYDGLKAVYGPSNTGNIPVYSKDGKTLIADRAGILSRWGSTFTVHLTRHTTTFDSCVVRITSLVWDTNYDLMQPPVRSKV